LRPARPSDAPAVANLWTRRAAARGQSSTYTAEDVEHRWQTPGFTLETDTQLAWDGPTLSGYSHLRDVKEPHVDLFVTVHLDPSVETDLDLADRLFQWVERRGHASLANAPGEARVVLIAGAPAEGASTEQLYLRRGFLVDRVFSEMWLDLASSPPAPEWPRGLAVRAFRPQDDVALVNAYRDAFRDQYGYLEQPIDAELERWRHWTRQPDFDPALWFLALDSDEVCGFCCCYAESHGDKETGLVDEFGVRPAWRKRGIGRALLLESFRAMRARGLKAAELTVDSDNRSDALALYAGVGMKVVSQSHTLLKELRPGRNLVVS